MRFLSLLVLALTLISSLGCVGTSPHYTQHPASLVSIRYIPVYVDKQFSMTDRLVIGQSLEEWNYALNGYEVMKVEDWGFDLQIGEIEDVYARHGLMILKVNSQCSFIPAQHGLQILGWTDKLNGHKVYVVRDRIWDQQQLHDVMLHEEAHALGADHIEGKNSLMSAEWDSSNYECVDYWTAEAVGLAQGIPVGKMNWCSYQ
jgi:hypothetical protein